MELRWVRNRREVGESQSPLRGLGWSLEGGTRGAGPRVLKNRGCWFETPQPREKRHQGMWGW